LEKARLGGADQVILTGPKPRVKAGGFDNAIDNDTGPHVSRPRSSTATGSPQCGHSPHGLTRVHYVGDLRSPALRHITPDHAGDLRCRVTRFGGGLGRTPAYQNEDAADLAVLLAQVARLAVRALIDLAVHGQPLGQRRCLEHLG
jgi:hypothetical protein